MGMEETIKAIRRVLASIPEKGTPPDDTGRQLAEAFARAREIYVVIGKAMPLEAVLGDLSRFNGLSEMERALTKARCQRAVTMFAADLPKKGRPRRQGPAKARSTARKSGRSPGPQLRKGKPEPPSQPRESRSGVPSSRLERKPVSSPPKNETLLDEPVEKLKGVGPRTGERLRHKGLDTLGDALNYLPYRYEDRRRGGCVAELEPGEPGYVVGTVARTGMRYAGRRPVFEVLLQDETGTLAACWFQFRRAYMEQRFRIGERLLLAGSVTRFRGQLQMVHPEVESVPKTGQAAGRIIPRYSEIEGITPRTLRRIIKDALPHAAAAEALLPGELARARGLPPLAESYQMVHAPPADADIESLNCFRHPAQQRLIFEEFFSLQLALAQKRRRVKMEEGIPFSARGRLAEKLARHLPFALTDAQLRVNGEIAADMRRPAPMNRLLQGDVGSGKTLVALFAALTALEEGYQAVLMAPTELLAEQHQRTLSKLLEPLGLNTVLITGSVTGARRRRILESIAEGVANVVVGTHALIEEGVVFDALGLAIIDEQHRFGVLQRARLHKKGLHPHVLVMTATPIPRTLAMTVYGDLDVSIIDALPPGRKSARTRVMRERQRGQAYELIRRELKAGRQAYVVYPLVEESEKLDLKDATGMAEELAARIFADWEVGLLHGRMKAAEKERVMARFIAGEIRVLVATTVIEVGIDVPNATVMMVEHAERFGLSQLHQLRGRVSRSSAQPHCLLMIAGSGTLDARQRLGTMAKTTDGFLIAEADLAIRGPGEFIGTRQSGAPLFALGSLVRDADIMTRARQAALEFIDQSGAPGHRRILDKVQERWRGLLDLAEVG